MPRTASVTALTDGVLCALERDDFLDAVTENVPSARAADAIVGPRLGITRPVHDSIAGA